jgi:hypothetical protein
LGLTSFGAAKAWRAQTVSSPPRRLNDIIQWEVCFAAYVSQCPRWSPHLTRDGHQTLTAMKEPEQYTSHMPAR